MCVELVFSTARRFAVFLLVLLLSGYAVAQPSPLLKDRIQAVPDLRHWVNICGTAGQSCCKPPHDPPAGLGPLVRCNSGLGCDIATNVCVSSCGTPGKVCCDGPETRSPGWTADGRFFSPTGRSLVDMCQGGACDRASHKCFACGTADGMACCPADAQQATEKCIGERLFCKTVGNNDTGGTCHRCGILGREPCSFGCDAPLDVRQGLCALCGLLSQPPCDRGCKQGLGIRQGVCQKCGGLNEAPCDSGCSGGLDIRGGTCQVCGGQGQPTCDSGCKSPLIAVNGVCQPCGANGQRPCQSGCRAGLSESAGRCQPCGAVHQITCNGGCNLPSLRNINGLCEYPPEPANCSNTNEQCVQPGNAGKQCCLGGGPQVCNFGFCKQCVAGSGECKLGGPQLCCTSGYVCRFDQETAKAVCGIPD